MDRNQRPPNGSEKAVSSAANKSAGPQQSTKCGDSGALCDVYWGASDVFIGKVIQIKRTSKQVQTEAGENPRKGPISIVQFKVAKSYRGAREVELDIANLPDDEGRTYQFIVGNEYLVSAQTTYESSAVSLLEPRTVVTVCSATKLLSEARKEIEYIEEQSQKYPNGNWREAPISGGLIQGKAISLPKPDYSQAAREAKASGRVYVLLLVNEKGNAIRAEAVCGDPLLTAAAEKAASQARFAPILLSGRAVKVSGIIVYNFALP